MIAGRDPTPGDPGPEHTPQSPPQRPSQDSTPEVAEALDIARRLAEAGFPIFVARSNPASPLGFALPPRWQHTPADPAVVDRWRPGDALCMVTGHGLDLIDLDPRNGGTLAALDGITPDTYARASTPSGGGHLFVKTLGLGSRDNVRRGVDYKGGEPDGSGRGFAFIAPTVRRSKVTGELVAYRWTQAPDLAALAEEGPDDTTGAALAALVRTARGEGDGGRPAVQRNSLFTAPGALFDAAPWDDIAGTLAGGRHRGVHQLAAALRGRGGWRTADAALLLDAAVWPFIDQGQGGHPYTRGEFLADIADVFERYPNGHGDDAGGGLVLRSAADIKIEPVCWLWPGRIPRGLLTLLVGRPGLGKTTLMVEVAARVSRGWNGEPPGVVLICTVEDSPAHTLVPRLVAAGADLAQVHFVSIRRDGAEGGITIPDDLAEIEEAITATGAVLVVVDPIAGHLSGAIDSHRDHQVRRALGPVAAVADHTGAAVVGIAHLNKAPSGDVLDRLGGSVGFGAAARSVLLFATPPDTTADGTSERVLVHGKCNVAPHAVTLKFAVEGRIVTDDGDEIATSGLAWLGEAPEIHASAVLTRPDGDESSKVASAADWLADLLAEGPVPYREVEKLATDEGIARRTLHRAKGKLRVVVERDDDTRGRPSIWRLPGPPFFVPPDVGTKPLARNPAGPNPLERKGFSDEPKGFVPPPDVGTKPRAEPESDLDELAARAAAGDSEAAAEFDRLLAAEQDDAEEGAA